MVQKSKKPTTDSNHLPCSPTLFAEGLHIRRTEPLGHPPAIRTVYQGQMGILDGRGIHPQVAPNPGLDRR